MAVSLLEAAGPRLRSKFAGAVRSAKPPERRVCELRCLRYRKSQFEWEIGQTTSDDEAIWPCFAAAEYLLRDHAGLRVKRRNCPSTSRRGDRLDLGNA
jgi:hypothetical protein